MFSPYFSPLLKHIPPGPRDCGGLRFPPPPPSQVLYARRMADISPVWPRELARASGVGQAALRGPTEELHAAHAAAEFTELQVGHATPRHATLRATLRYATRHC